MISASKRTTLLLAAAGSLALSLSSCKNGGLFKSKKEQSNATGWNYNDKDQGGFYVPKEKEVKTAPGLVFIQGGTFSMGSTQQDVMGDWNNRPRRVTVSSFFIDKYEVSNVDYREYLHWIDNVFSGPEYTKIVEGAKPDTLVWRSELAYNEPYVEYYFRHPSFNNYPVVGVSWKQAHDFCIWRTDRVNEKALINSGYQNKSLIKEEMGGGGKNNFNTKAYLAGAFEGTPTNPKGKKAELLDAQGNPRNKVQFEDGILFPDYRLPTEAEWEYAALGLIEDNIHPSKNNKRRRGEEILSDKQVYPWPSDGYDGLRATKRGNERGGFLANFKRGTGDYMGTAGGLNDNAATPAPVNSFYPNGFGLYNMAGNVSEWVADVYRPNSSIDVNDLNPFRGNVFQQPVTENGQVVLDSMGRIVYRQEPDSISAKRRNYQKAYAINFSDGDSSSNASYGYGYSTLINDHSRVYKGGSWDDLPYWLSPGTRRFLDENLSSATIGFRCAMTHYGGQIKGDAGAGQGLDFKPARRVKR